MRNGRSPAWAHSAVAYERETRQKREGARKPVTSRLAGWVALHCTKLYWRCLDEHGRFREHLPGNRDT
jgi:hypothetical protein